MDEIYDEPISTRLKRIPRLALLGCASLAAILCAGFVANVMLIRSQIPAQPPIPATAQIYTLPAEDPAAESMEIVRPAEPLPEHEISPETVAAIPPKPLAKPVQAKPRCEADECVSWETTVTRALAASPGGSAPKSLGNLAPASSVQPNSVMSAQPMPQQFAPMTQRGPIPLSEPMPAQRGPMPPRVPMPQRDVPYLDEPVDMRREPSTVGGIAKSAASTVVTQSGKLVDNLMRWSDTAVSKLTTPPRWPSSDQPANP